MARRKKTYWEKREAEAQNKLTNKSIKDTEKQLAKYYKSAMLGVLDEFEKTYNKLLSSIAEGKEPTPADLYKLDTYWQMQASLKKELQRLGDLQTVLLADNFARHYQTIYESTALLGESAYNKIDTETAHRMINSIWCADGKSWSQRVWDNTDKLQETLNNNLLHCVITGKKASELKQILQEDFNVSFRRADTIVRTELAHIQTESAKQRYIDYGIREVEVLADEDAQRCDKCAKLDGQRFPIHGKMPVPAHPNCRCCILPVIDNQQLSFFTGVRH